MEVPAGCNTAVGGLMVPAAANRLQSALGGFLSGGLTLALDA